jgi:hypothetical protein
VGTGVDCNVDPVDTRRPFGSAFGVFEFQLFADLEKAEVAADSNRAITGFLDLRTHGRGQAVDV